jgi:hypothetical protein
LARGLLTSAQLTVELDKVDDWKSEQLCRMATDQRVLVAG